MSEWTTIKNCQVLSTCGSTVVHRYNVLDDKIVFESIKSLLSAFEEFVAVVEEWLRDRV